MKDINEKNEHDSPEEPDNSSDRPTVSYSPHQRRKYLEGLRAWARVAVRSYAKRHCPPGEPPAMPDEASQAEEET